jgi:four helix bundle protein
VKDNIIKSKSFEFSLQMISLYKKLIDEREYVFSKQLLRAATSIGANVVEAEAAQTKPDFIAKIFIASKEARETKYWLQLLHQSEITKIEVECFLNDIEELIKILTSIGKTAQQKKLKSSIQHSTLKIQN